MDIQLQFANKHILIIDNDTDLSNSIKEFLLEKGFKKISHAQNLTDGVDIYDTQNIDLILLEVLLPDGEGDLLIKYVRKSSDIPIIFLSKKIKLEDEIKGLKMGADDYIKKPVLPEILFYRILSLLRRSYKADSNIIQLKNSLINLENASVLNQEKKLSLTPIELQIIRKLYANNNRIVSIENICDAIWGLESHCYKKSLMVHIRNIREKIELNPSKPEHLITVKGLGYKFKL